MKSALSLRSLIGIAIVASCSVALAAWPERTIQYVIAFAPGGESDIAARLQAETFKTKFGKEMIVVNKPGAGGGLAWSQMNTTAGDGYTITGINLPHIVLQPLEGTANFKTEDTTPVYWFHYTPDAIIVAADSPFKTLDGPRQGREGQARGDHIRGLGHQQRQSRRVGALRPRLQGQDHLCSIQGHR